jgi:hypothetical protein
VLIIAGVFFFLPNLALLLLVPETAGEAEARVAGQVDLNAMFAMAGKIYGEIWWQLVLVSLLSAVGMLGLLALLTDRRRPTVGEALMTGIKCLLTSFAAQIIMGLIVGAIIAVPLAVGSAAGGGAGVLVGLVAFVAVIYVLTKFSLTVPVLVIEGVMNPVRALARSWALTKGNSFRLFLFYVLLFVAFMVIAMVLLMIGGVVGAIGGEEVATFVGALINSATNMIGLTLYLAVQASAHRQLSGGTPQALGETFQ